MRVVVLVDRDPRNPVTGGGDITLGHWARVLAARGEEVTILCSTFPGAPRREVWEGVTIERVGPEMALGLFAALAYLRRHRARTDVVVEDVLGGARIPFFAPLYVRGPLIAVWHQDHGPIFHEAFGPLLGRLLGALERIMVELHHDVPVLSPSRASREAFARKGGDPAQVHIYDPGLEPQFLALPPTPAGTARGPQVLFLGKLRRYKCPHHAVRAFAEVSASEPQATLVLAGRPDEPGFLEELRGLIHASGLEERVRLEVGISEERKMELLRTSRVLLSPAPVEGYSIAVLEASACGTPVVGSEGVPQEALVEGVNGFRVPFGDIHALAARTLQLLKDDALFDRISASASHLAAGRSWEHATEPLVQLVRSVGPAGPRGASGAGRRAG